MLPLTRQTLMQRLADMDIRVVTIDHAPAFTVAESAVIHDAIPGGHTKNLFLRDARGACILVVAHIATRIDLKGLANVIGSGRLSFARAEELSERLGVAPGSVTAFALANDTDCHVRVIFDRALLAFDVINLHPLENSATTSIARDDLLRFIHATGHHVEFVDLAPDH